jgi:RNA polymerase sigma-70 factor (ECF subfamily)
LLAVYLKIDTFRGTSRFSTWLHRITLNAFLMHERSCKRKQLLFVPDDILDVFMEAANGRETDSLPSLQLQRKELVENLARLVSELPGSFREIILLRDQQGLSIWEVSRCLGLSISAVKSRHHRARKMLKTRIERDFFKK